jgi:glyoxylase-like metal-dependent hydrolase (beta-lactamase superfamily II)
MTRARFVCFNVLLVTAMVLLSVSVLKAQGQPDYETIEVADNVYIFRYGGSQSMFLVTPEGVIATDPINAQASRVYMEEIRKLTSEPVRYVVYSHHHLDHVSGGAVFKEAGATFVAQRQAKAALLSLDSPNVVIPDLLVDDQSVLTLGGMELELNFVGRNHSDNSLVMRVPDAGVIFAVDFLPVRELPFRNFPDSYLLEYFESIDRVLAMDWDRMIAGHSRQGGIGTKDDIRALKVYLDELFALVRTANAEGQCFDQAFEEIQLPSVATDWIRQEFLPGNIERMCYFFRNGYR